MMKLTNKIKTFLWLLFYGDTRESLIPKGFIQWLEKQPNKDEIISELYDLPKTKLTCKENLHVRISKEDFIFNCDASRQNLNGRENEQEIFLAGIESVIEELNIKFN